VSKFQIKNIKAIFYVSILYFFNLFSNGWAFVTTASVEFAIWKNQSRTVTLSPQELVDCSHSFGNKGCHDGGSIDFGYFIF
jgi:hypothetical protein